MNANIARAQDIGLVQEFGTPGADQIIGMDLHSHGIYAVGAAGAALPGQVYAGGSQDAFVKKYDSKGSEMWTREFGTPGWDMAHGAATTAEDGIVVTGMVGGTLPGQAFLNGGGVGTGSMPSGLDAFVRVYDGNGNEIWTREFGTHSADNAVGAAVAGDGSIYVEGMTEGTLPGQKSAGGLDVFVVKFSADGDAIWTRQFGSKGNDYIGYRTDAIVVDGQNVYIAGLTTGSLPGQTSFGGLDGFVRKYDASGGEVWTRQIGTAGDDDFHGIVFSQSYIYLAGSSSSALPGRSYAGGGDDSALWKFDRDGNELWVRELGTSGYDHFDTVTAGGSGIYAVGYTDSAFPGQTNAGRLDVLVIAFDTNGNTEWTLQFGSTESDYTYAAVVDHGRLFLGGGTNGALPGQSFAGGPLDFGGADAFLAKILIPE